MDKAIAFHKRNKGKIEVISRTPLKDRETLSLAYTPGVANVCREIVRDPSLVREYTRKGNMVAVVTDGSAVLGLGNIGPEASLPVMEGKCILFKEFAGVDAFPIALDTQDPQEIIETVVRIAPMFGGINLEDIAAPQCFAIEKALRERLAIPVFHDDQHGTAIVVLAGLYNALRVVEKELATVRIVINGAGAAGMSIADLLLEAGAVDVILLDSQGVLHPDRRESLNAEKRAMLSRTNPRGISGGIADALREADVFIGVSRGGLVNKEMVASMNEKAIVFALANPTPEIMPGDAVAGGAAVIATGRSDFPNQLNNVLAFPGIFRGLLDAKKTDVPLGMQVAVARAIADIVAAPTAQEIIPDVFDNRVVPAVAHAVNIYENE